MKKINNKKMFKTFIFVIITMCFFSCNNQRTNIDKNERPIEAKLNDSLDIKIYFDGKNNTISTIIIKNNNNKINNIYGFHDDGITPSLIGSEKNGVKKGLYYTYYSTGVLNNRINYIEGEIDGEYVSYSEQGKVIYRAYYEKGVEKEVEVEDSTKNIEIEEIKE